MTNNGRLGAMESVQKAIAAHGEARGDGVVRTGGGDIEIPIP